MMPYPCRSPGASMRRTRKSTDRSGSASTALRVLPGLMRHHSRNCGTRTIGKMPICIETPQAPGWLGGDIAAGLTTAEVRITQTCISFFARTLRGVPGCRGGARKPIVLDPHLERRPRGHIHDMLKPVRLELAAERVAN